MNNILLSILHGILLGGAYGLIAVGLSVIFGVIRIVNFAHGAVLMASAFAYYELFSRFKIDPFMAMFIIAPVFFIIGFLLQKVVIRPLLIRERASVLEPTSVMLFTIGLDYAIANLYLMIYSASNKTVNSWSYGHYVRLFDGKFVTQWSRVITFGLMIIVAFGLWFIINRTEMGKRIRAVSQNRDAAALCGVNVHTTYGIAFGLGTAAVAIAGACMASFYLVSPSAGNVFGTKSFMIVVLGGLGSIQGAIVGGLIFGLIEQVGAQFMPSSMASIVSFALFLIVLVVKPNGLLGGKRK
ncbi:MAG: branched-chain amino acid ABC transporter permease [Agathobaculum sp.]|jgi:branched-chain amino acid transport system permease protein|uniref:branched-chain amino acid ABC transporter permease n=1 Tax=Agathobaculum sp. TaxID=2048138 RepID=UPI003D91C873